MPAPPSRLASAPRAAVFIGDVPEEEILTNLSIFERAVIRAAGTLKA
jgi:hypothetical protein